MKKIKGLLVIFIIILGSIFFFWNDILYFYSGSSLQLSQIEKGVDDFLIKEIEKRVSTPPPLRAAKENPQSFLTKAGVIQWANIQREQYGLPLFKENAALNISAELKAQDMFTEQYFAHSSPSGEGVGDLAKIVGYEFITIGENLAFGNFKNDEALVQGWMDSPGHRENILNARYQEIGVAVLKGIFEGRSVWLAAQHFGLPLSACPQPDETLAAKIEIKQNQIKELRETLQFLQSKIKTIRPKRGAAYNRMIEQYNTFVSQHNTLMKETDILGNEYNNQVELFNECAVGSAE